MLAVELAGRSELCTRDGDALLAAPRAVERAFSVDAVGAVQSGDSVPALRARLSLLPGELDSALAALNGAGLSVAVLPAAGLVEATLSSDRIDAVTDAETALNALAAEVSGRIEVRVEPPGGEAAVRFREAITEPGEAAVLASLRRRFDPTAVLGPHTATVAEGA